MLINVQGNHMILANQNWSIRKEKHNPLNWGFLKNTGRKEQYLLQDWIEAIRMRC